MRFTRSLVIVQRFLKAGSLLVVCALSRTPRAGSTQPIIHYFTRYSKVGGVQVALASVKKLGSRKNARQFRFPLRRAGGMTTDHCGGWPMPAACAKMVSGFSFETNGAWLGLRACPGREGYLIPRTIMVMAMVDTIISISILIGTSVTMTRGYPPGATPLTPVPTAIQEPTSASAIYLPLISSHCLPFSQSTSTLPFFWSTCFDSLDEVQTDHLNAQGRCSLVDDITGSGRGKILKCEAAPDLAYFAPQYTPNGRTVVRSYPTMYFPQKHGPHLVGLDVYVEDDFSPAIQSTSDGPYLSLLSDFYEAYGAAWIIGATADLKLVGESYFLTLGNVKNQRTLPPAAPFTFGRWHRIEIMVTEQRQVQLYQDRQLVSVAELRDGVGVATGGGHPGLYGLSADGLHVAPFNTGTLYNDSWTMSVWPSP
jgi:hypothetical protein